MTLEEICLEIEARYGPITDECEIRGIVMVAREEGLMTNLALTVKEVAEALIYRFNTREALPKEEMSELDNDKFVTEEISSPEIPMPNLSLDDKFAVPLGIAVNGTSASDKFVIEGVKVHGFLCVINANFVIEYYTTASAVADKIGICRRTKVPKLKVGDKFGNIEILYINHK